MTYNGGVSAPRGASSLVNGCGALREKKIFEEERRQIRSARKSRLAIHGERLLTYGALARMPKLGNLLVTKALELEQRDLTLRFS